MLELNDNLFIIFENLNIKDLINMSYICKDLNSKIKLYKKQKLLTRNNIFLKNKILNHWKMLVCIKYYRGTNCNSWLKKNKDPEREILLF